MREARRLSWPAWEWWSVRHLVGAQKRGEAMLGCLVLKIQDGLEFGDMELKDASRDAL